MMLLCWWQLTVPRQYGWHHRGLTITLLPNSAWHCRSGVSVLSQLLTSDFSLWHWLLLTKCNFTARNNGNGYILSYFSRQHLQPEFCVCWCLWQYCAKQVSVHSFQSWCWYYTCLLIVLQLLRNAVNNELGWSCGWLMFWFTVRVSFFWSSVDFLL